MDRIILKKPVNPACWLRIYRLYRQAFPRQERKPFRIILEKYRQGSMDVWCVCRGGKFSGLVITINSPELILLDYLAVAPECRGTGVGTKTLELVRQQYRGKPVFLEIESVYEDTPEREMRLRRKRFYLRCGLKPMGVMVRLFGVKMELLSWDRKLTFPEYLAFYRDHYMACAEKFIQEEKHPEAQERDFS